MVPSSALFMQRMTHSKYTVSEDSLNIVGWRYPNLHEGDAFTDYIAVYWRDKGPWKQVFWPATTYPGIPWLLNPMRINGTAVLVPGQYVDAYKLGLHKGYKALVQAAPVTVYRDNNRDSQINCDPGTIERGMFGIDIHRAGIWSKIIGQNSAGCQVFQKSNDFDKFIGLCELEVLRRGNRFTYTLLEIRDGL